MVSSMQSVAMKPQQLIRLAADLTVLKGKGTVMCEFFRKRAAKLLPLEGNTKREMTVCFYKRSQFVSLNTV